MKVDTDFDQGLLEIEHFCKYPAMLPFVGPAYRGPDHRKTLLLGESNYLPKGSTIHLVAAEWYAGSQKTLSREQVDWVDCRRLLMGSWPGKPQMIYREISQCLEEAGVAHPDRGMSTVAFMNAFQRPAADTGGSMKNCITDLDRTKSLQAIADTVRVLSPELVIFASRFAWAVFGRVLQKEFPDLRIEHVCHPGSPYHWRVADYAHGRSKLMAILRYSFMTTTVSSPGDSLTHPVSQP